MNRCFFSLYFCFGNAIGNDRRLKLKTIEGRGIHFVKHCRTHQLIELATRKEINHNKKNIKKQAKSKTTSSSPTG